MAHAAWADAEEYVSRHRGSREDKWLALYRDGERTVGVICVIIDADGHPVEERERVTLRCTPLDISTYCKDAQLIVQLTPAGSCTFHLCAASRAASFAAAMTLLRSTATITGTTNGCDWHSKTPCSL